MPRYYVPPAPGTSPVRTRSAWRQLLPLGIGVLVLGLLLTSPGHEVLGVLGVVGVVVLYLLVVFSPWLLGFGGVIYLLTRLDRQYSRRRSPPRPAPTWLWQPWEVVLSVAVVLLAFCYYAVVDGSRWLRRRWRKRQQRRATRWKAPQPA